MFLIFDTETTGLPKNFSAPIHDLDNWPRLVQLAWQLHDHTGKLIEKGNHIVRPHGFTIPFNSYKIHGINTEKANREGKPLLDVLNWFNRTLEKTPLLVGHNISFDINILGAEFLRTKTQINFLELNQLDTKKSSTEYCAIPGGKGRKFKWPTLEELHQKLFQEGFGSAHNAAADVSATARSFLEMIRLKLIPKEDLHISEKELEEFLLNNPKVVSAVEWKEIDSEKEGVQEEVNVSNINENSNKKQKKSIIPYAHLHNHTSFSVLSAASKVNELVDTADDFNMKSVGITDHGNMMGAFHFLEAINKKNKEKEGEENILGVVGCEIYCSEQYLQKKFTKDNPDRRYNQALLAKNKNGFYNLSKLCSHGFVDGYYAGFPRVNKELITRYKKDLIALTGGLRSEIPDLILNIGETQAEEAFQWWHKEFTNDFYVELIRHGLEEEDHVNEVLLRFAKKYNVPYIAQNNTYYLNKENANAHDILLCVRDGEKQKTPIGRGRGFRFGFPNQEFYVKSSEEMNQLFEDLPEAIANIEPLLEKFEPYTLEREVLLPEFKIPKEFENSKDTKDSGKRGENAFLRHLTFEGAKKRYPEITEEIENRLNFELKVIEKIGYPGYFLIVQDICNKAKEMDVVVGPGRGSAAGSTVAYCIGITNVDPIKYQLLFERFLNPERVSLPDIDIDFDDRGRDKIIDWVVEKYGHSQVAQIITYGTMGGKSAIRDTARVLDLPLPETDLLAKKVPPMPLNQLFSLDEKTLREKLGSDELENALDLRKTSKEETLAGKTLKQASILEGSLRNTGIHACGMIITPSDIRELIPVSISKDSNLLSTQFDNSAVEKAGLLKMDFLGLKTLTLIKDACTIIEKRSGVKLNPDEFPLDDEKTYELFQKGETIGIFQYESVGMQRYLKQLKPDKFDDLIAMNALYRPGPLRYIPNFIARKQGKETIEYDLPEMEEILKSTYGITVYQEQVMQLSQIISGFTKGEADLLRKAMGKKIRALLNKLKPKFISGGKKRGHEEFTLEKIWKDWEAFAAYAFNKSHSTCYAYIAFQTAYLKAHYPAEYMASVLSNNMNDIKQITFFMEECKRMNTTVLGPDINESRYRFTVNQKGQIRFGMGGIKGVGKNAVENIVREREKNKKYVSIFDVTGRLDPKNTNKKILENLALAGAFDCFENTHRAQYLFKENGHTFLEKAIKFGTKLQAEKKSSQMTLFASFGEDQLMELKMPEIEPWSKLELLNREKEVVGVYITAHPLDEFKYEIKHFTRGKIADLSDSSVPMNTDLFLAGMIMEVDHLVSQKGRKYATYTLEDYSGSYYFRIFGETYLKFKYFLQEGSFIHQKIRVSENKETMESFVRILDIKSLYDVLDHFSKKLTITLTSNNLEEKIVKNVESILKKNKGKKPFEIELIDDQLPVAVSLKSKKTGVKINKELLDALQKSEQVKYRLN